MEILGYLLQRAWPNLTNVIYLRIYDLGNNLQIYIDSSAPLCAKVIFVWSTNFVLEFFCLILYY